MIDTFKSAVTCWSANSFLGGRPNTTHALVVDMYFLRSEKKKVHTNKPFSYGFLNRTVSFSFFLKLASFLATAYVVAF